MIRKVIVSEFSKKAKTDLAKLRGYAAKTSGSPPAPKEKVETEVPRGGTAPTPPEPPAPKEKKKFPSSSGGTENAPSGDPKTRFDAKDTEQALKVLFGNVG
jgi:hypothetical protein